MQNIDFKIKSAIYLHQNFRKVRLKRKINQEKKTNKHDKQTKTTTTNKKVIPSHPNQLFWMIFEKQFTCFHLKNLLSMHNRLRYGIMLYTMYQFFVWAIVLFELIKANFFLSFRSFGFQLWAIFMNFFSLDLNT